jgi:hypothetical protein
VISICRRCGEPGERNYCRRCGAALTRWRSGRLFLIGLALLACGAPFLVAFSILHVGAPSRRIAPESSRIELWDGLTSALPNGARVTLRLDRRARRFALEVGGRRQWLGSRMEIEGPRGDVRLWLIGQDVQRGNAWFEVEARRER